MGSTDDATTAAFWDARAASFDDEADHSLRDPAVRRAWFDLLADALGDRAGTVVDIGCGTGSVSLLLAESGHRVVGIDASVKMIDQARGKVARHGLDVSFAVGDVATAERPDGPLVGVVCRHLLWAVPDPSAVIARWTEPLAHDGAFIAVEGVWNGAGIHAEQMAPLLHGHFRDVELTDLTDNDALWGKHVTDHRYLAVARHPT